MDFLVVVEVVGPSGGLILLGRWRRGGGAVVVSGFAALALAEAAEFGGAEAAEFGRRLRRRLLGDGLAAAALGRGRWGGRWRG